MILNGIPRLWITNRERCQQEYNSYRITKQATVHCKTNLDRIFQSEDFEEDLEHTPLC